MSIQTVQVSAATVLRGDVINVGGLSCCVMDLVTLTGGAKRLVFQTGDTLTMHPRTELRATRPAPARTRLAGNR